MKRLIPAGCSVKGRSGELIIALVFAALGTPVAALGQSAVWQPQGATSGNIYYNGGNVGIGTTSPDYQLQVNTTGTSGLRVDASGNGNQTYLSGSAGGTQLLQIYRPSTTNDIYIQGFGSMILQPSSGSVGVGTSSPEAKFQVGSRSDAVTNRMMVVNDSTALKPVIFSYVLSGSVEKAIALDGANAKLYFSHNPAGYSNTALANAAQLTLTPGGYLGIGATSPQSMLAVNGTITTKEVVVANTGWPDYVFAPGYQLAPLADIATFVEANHHLPGIPSAIDVADKGIGLGEMQGKLLAKIEELTLHMIELEKRDTQLEQKNAQLERQNQEINARLLVLDVPRPTK